MITVLSGGKNEDSDDGVDDGRLVKFEIIERLLKLKHEIALVAELPGAVQELQLGQEATCGLHWTLDNWASIINEIIELEKR